MTGCVAGQTTVPFFLRVADLRRRWVVSSWMTLTTGISRTKSSNGRVPPTHSSHSIRATGLSSPPARSGRAGEGRESVALLPHQGTDHSHLEGVYPYYKSRTKKVLFKRTEVMFGRKVRKGRLFLSNEDTLVFSLVNFYNKNEHNTHVRRKARAAGPWEGEMHGVIRSIRLICVKILDDVKITNGITKNLMPQ